VRLIDLRSRELFGTSECGRSDKSIVGDPIRWLLLAEHFGEPKIDDFDINLRAVEQQKEALGLML
jgi:hypothetical protein